MKLGAVVAGFPCVGLNFQRSDLLPPHSRFKTEYITHTVHIVHSLCVSCINYIFFFIVHCQRVKTGEISDSLQHSVSVVCYDMKSTCGNCLEFVGA